MDNMKIIQKIEKEYAISKNGGWISFNIRTAVAEGK